MGKVLRCPHCVSKDCKEKTITFDKMEDTLVGFGEQVVKYLFTGKYDYRETVYNASQVGVYNITSRKKTYRCKQCGFVWEN